MNDEGRFFRVRSAALGAAILAACLAGAACTDERPPPLTPVPPDLDRLTFAVEGKDGNPHLVRTLEVKLVEAGAKVVTENPAVLIKISGAHYVASAAGVPQAQGRVECGLPIGDSMGLPYAECLATKMVNALLATPILRRIQPAAPASAGPPPAAAPAANAAPMTATLARGSPQPTAYGLVIGIERYRDLPPPPGARADAESMAALLRTTLGLPEANLRVALDERATRSDIERHLSWLEANVPPNGRAYFFFSGHGAPDAAGGGSFLVPYEGDAQAIGETSIPLDKVLAKLGASRAKEVLAFVDACFSGAGGRSILPKGARPLVKLRDLTGPKSVALFTAASGAQISGPSKEGNRGAFTKWLLQAVGEAKADIDGDGQLTLDELATWVTPRVEQEAKQQSREQTPRLVVGSGVGEARNVAVAWGLKDMR